MILLLITLFIFQYNIPSFPSDWEHIGTFRDGEYYIDNKDIKYEGLKVTFWWKVENTEIKRVKTTLDCENKLWTIKDAFIYKPDGSLGAIVHIIDKNLEWVEIIPDSIAEKWYEFLCKER